MSSRDLQPNQTTRSKPEIATQRQVSERMAVLFAALPCQERYGSEELRARAYLLALEDVPLAVLDSVVRDVLKGQVPDISPVFAPSPPQLAQLCRARLAQHERMQPRPPALVRRDDDPSEEAKQRVTEKVEKVLRELVHIPPSRGPVRSRWER